MTQPQVSLETIVDAMSVQRDGGATLGWDVVVNYRETEINALLLESYHNDPNGHLMSLPIDITAMNQDLEPFTVSFEFQLGPPRVQFNGAAYKPSCSLFIPVDGGHSHTSTKTLPIPPGVYEIELRGLEMATMHGTAGQTTPSDTTFVFSPQSGPAVVTIDFPTSNEITVNLNGTSTVDGNPQVNAHAGDLYTGLYAFFTDPQKTKSIQYQLASVNPESPPADIAQLCPKSFRFAAYESQDHPYTILSLFISTQESTTGTDRDLQTKWGGLWQGIYNVPPIPDTHTASIILSSKMMHETVILPALRAQGMSALDRTFDASTGWSYAITTHTVISRPSESCHNGNVVAFSVSLDTPQNALHLTLSRQGQSVVSWTFDYKFVYTSEDKVWYWFGQYQTNVYPHNVSIRNVLKDQVSDFNSRLKDAILEMDIASITQNDWKEPTVKPENPQTFKNAFGNPQGPDWIKTNVPELPSLTLNMGSIGFFLTTNLLMPGQQVITIDAGPSGGLRVPYDFYLVGSVRH